jgi:hypothetical protein
LSEHLQRNPPGYITLPVDGGVLVNVQPTERTFEVQHIYIYRALDGKITSRMSCNLCSGLAFGSAGGQVHAEHFANRDDVGMMMWQLGLLPPPRRCRSVGWLISAIRRVVALATPLGNKCRTAAKCKTTDYSRAFRRVFDSLPRGRSC